MTFKQFMKDVYLAPAHAFAFLNRMLFGTSYQDPTSGRDETSPGLVTLVLGAANWAFTGIGNFVANHKKAIATAFWASLTVAGAAALTVALWPAALAAVVGFSVYGVSIATLVGTGFVAQVAATAGVAAALTSAAVYAGAAVVNSVNAIIGCFCKSKGPIAGKKDVLIEDLEKNPKCRNQFAALNSGGSTNTKTLADSNELVDPKQTKSVFAPPQQGFGLGTQEPVQGLDETRALSASN